MKYFDNNVIKEIEKYRNKKTEGPLDISGNYAIVQNEKVFFEDCYLFDDVAKLKIPVGNRKSDMLSDTLSGFNHNFLSQQQIRYIYIQYPNLPIKIAISQHPLLSNALLHNIHLRLIDEFTNNRTNCHIINCFFSEEHSNAFIMFRESLIENNLFNIIFLKSLSEYTYLGHMQCINKFSDDWDKIFPQMMESLHSVV